MVTTSNLKYGPVTEQLTPPECWNQTVTNYPKNKCIWEIFEQQVEQTPEGIAAVFAGEQLTYQELNQKANQVASYIRDLGVKSEELIGICVERSLEMLVGILGILKAGGVYVPLDPSLPTERLNFLLEDTQVSFILTQQRLLESIPSHQCHMICLDRDWSQIQTKKTENTSIKTSSNQLAYIMYTSGSTGQPKGVKITHRGVVRLVKETYYAEFSPDEVFLQLAPISFDASTFEIWGCLLNGAKLVVFPSQTPSLEELGEVIEQSQITTLWLTAGLFHLIVDTRLEYLKPIRQLLAGGDALSVPHVQKVLNELPNCQLINGYGPTENTTFTCCYPIKHLPPSSKSVPIGRPIANTQVYILDPEQKPVSIGIAGEVYVGGDGLAQGYLNRPDLTEEKFIPNPFSDEKEARLYKTGDLGRYLPDGNIEFLGRLDYQVKIRGFRIELGEIETSLAQHPGVNQTVVIMREDIPGDQRLVAYVIPHPEQSPQNSELRRFLEDKLPNYMVPGIFVFLDEFPLTFNGKVNRTALPKPDIIEQHTEDFIAPRTEQEMQMAKIWEEVLDIYPVGIQDNFFDLGGHSLLPIRLVTESEKDLGKKLPLSAIFEMPTIEAVTQVIYDKDYKGRCLMPIQANGSKLPLFLFQGFEIYRPLSQYLGSDQPVYGLSIEMIDNSMTQSDSFINRLEDLAAHYIEEMKSIQPESPYILGGISFGGVVALEVAQQLIHQKQKVAFLGLFDTAGPNPYHPHSLPQRLLGHLNHVANFGLPYIAKKFNDLKKRFRWINYQLSKVLDYEIADEKRYSIVNKIYQDAAAKYKPQIYPGKITLFKATEENPINGTVFDPKFGVVDPYLGWQQLSTTGVDVQGVPGGHITMLKEPHVQVLAEKVRICIDKGLTEIQS